MTQLSLKLDAVFDDSTCSSGVSSVEQFGSCSESSTPRWRSDPTLVLLDWDDTLCPTTICEQDDSKHDDLLPALGDFAREASALLHHAVEVADKVMVVTNGGEGWV